MLDLASHFPVCDARISPPCPGMSECGILSAFTGRKLILGMSCTSNSTQRRPERSRVAMDPTGSFQPPLLPRFGRRDSRTHCSGTSRTFSCTDELTLAVKSHDGQHIDSPNCEIDGQKALATGDVVIKHATDPGLFKIVGRLDDQLVLSTGEKVRIYETEHVRCSR